MAYDLSTLLAPKSADTLTTEALALLAARGFPVTAWQAGSVARTLVEVDTATLADLYVAVQSVAGGAFLDLAAGAWLTLLAYHRFQIERTPAQFATGTVRLTCASGSGPYTINAGRLIVSNGTRRFVSTNTAAVTVPSGGYVDVTVRAELAGTAGNVGSGTVTTIVSPALAGVTCTNASAFAGGDAEESDAALRTRCRAKWATLGRGATLAAYVYHATDVAHTGVAVTRALALANPGDGTVTVYVAKAGGAASSGEAAAVQTYVESQNPITDALTVLPATAVPVNIEATIEVRAANDSTANRTLATDALSAYFAGLAIGDDVDLGAIYAAIRQASGVIDVDVSAPSADTSVGASQVATLGTVTLTWTAV